MATITRAEIIQQVLDRMDEICPAEDINISEGELIDRLMDDALLQFLRMANVDTLYTESQAVAVTSESDRSVFGSFAVPANFIRFVSCSCSRWKRDLHESDLLTSDSGEWKMAHMRFREPGPCKPLIALLPKAWVPKPQPPQIEEEDLENENEQLTDVPESAPQNIFGIAPYKEGDTVKVSYVAEIKPEDFYTARVGANVDEKSESLWLAYIWYLTGLVLQTMGQPELSTAALAHVQGYNVVPSGMPAPAQS